MKLFVVANGIADSDFDINKKLSDDEMYDADDREKGYMIASGSNAHSGGAVILAENIEDAKEILYKRLIEGVIDNSKCEWWTKEHEERRKNEIENLNVGHLVEIHLDRKGIVLFCDGAC